MGSQMIKRSTHAALNPQEILANAVYLTPEAAALLRVQPSTIRTAVRLGRISGKGRPFRIRGSELFKLV
jgi:hypothetical protein